MVRVQMEVLVQLCCVDLRMWFLGLTSSPGCVEVRSRAVEAADPEQHGAPVEAVVHGGHEAAGSGGWDVDAVREGTQDPGGSSGGKTEGTEEPCETRSGGRPAHGP